MEQINPSNGIANNPFANAVGLSAVWQKCMFELYKSDCRPLVDREHGQLGNIRKSLGMKQATEVVEYAIRNWVKFAQKAAKQVGSDIVPPKPTIGWLYQYHGIAVLMLQEELQSIAKKQAEEEQAKAEKEAQAQEAAKAMEELKSKHPTVTLIRVTQEQHYAFLHMLDDPANEAWVDKVTEKYGEWRPAKPNEQGIPCGIALKKAG